MQREEEHNIRLQNHSECIVELEERVITIETSLEGQAGVVAALRVVAQRSADHSLACLTAHSADIRRLHDLLEKMDARIKQLEDRQETQPTTNASGRNSFFR